MSGAPGRVSLAVREERIELAGYAPDATVRDLVEEVERFRMEHTQLTTARCAGCGTCCNQRIPVFAEDMDGCASRARGSAREQSARPSWPRPWSSRSGRTCGRGPRASGT